jgi:hypothetical protein
MRRRKRSGGSKGKPKEKEKEGRGCGSGEWAGSRSAGGWKKGRPVGHEERARGREVRFINRRRRFSESLSLKRGHRVTGTRISAAKRVWENGHIDELLST